MYVVVVVVARVKYIAHTILNYSMRKGISVSVIGTVGTKVEKETKRREKEKKK